MQTPALLPHLANVPNTLATPLLDKDGRSEISKSFVNSRWDLPWEVVLLGLGAILVCIATISAYRWWQQRHDDPTPLVLFSAIARKAGLTWGERLLLWRIARSEDLPTPIALLLARGTLNHYARTFAAKLSPRGRERVLARIARLQHQLFDEPARDTFTRKTEPN